MAKFEGHKKLHSEDRELILNDFYNSFLLIENESELISYLNDLLSEPELEMLARRVQIARMLKEGFTYEEIRNALYVSEGTVASCAQSLKRGEGGLDLVATRLAGLNSESDEAPEESPAESEVSSPRTRTVPMISRLRESRASQTKKVTHEKGSLKRMRLARQS